jgi:hypothetical protein
LASFRYKRKRSLPAAASRRAKIAVARSAVMLRKLRFACVYSLCLLAVLGGPYYLLFWRPFVAALRQVERPATETLVPVRYVEPRVLERLGNVKTDKRSSFVNFVEAKPPGIIRLCAFGDSFTYGDEVAADHDFPSLLQAMFRRRGADNVQVINFGSSWYGFHQAFMMWDFVGRHFACDYVLLGPRCFWPDRDTAFNHTDLQSPYFLHSRFVLDGDDVRRVDVLGATNTERFDNYFSLLPHWRYLRYDRNPPAIVRSLLPAGRTVPNPFYYYAGAAADEAVRMYDILLRKLAATGVQIAVLQPREGMVDLGGAANANLAVSTYDDGPMVGYPYRAPRGHYTAWGNQLIAEMFFAQIMRGGGQPLVLLSMDDANAAGSSPADHGKLPLWKYDRIEVELEGRPAGLFRARTVGREPPDALQSAKTVSLLAVKDPDEPLVDALFVPLPFELADGAPAIVRTAGRAGPREHALGTIRLLAENVNVGALEVEGVHDVHLREVPVERALSIAVEQGRRILSADYPDRGTAVEVSVGNKPVLIGTADAEGIHLQPGAGDFQHIRVREPQLTDLDAVPASGTVDLCLTRQRWGTQRVPIARLEKVTREIAHAERPLRKLLCIDEQSRTAVTCAEPPS